MKIILLFLRETGVDGAAVISAIVGQKILRLPQQKNLFQIFEEHNRHP